MASNPPIVEDTCNAETDEETIAVRKKRSRRVSFADREITSVHIFNRDEDYETPPDCSAKDPSSGNAAEAENEVLGFFRDLADSDDSKEMSPTGDEDDEDDIVNARKSFLRPVESPSPGSTIVGSATSNDEDNFFGPVSASFIRPGRLSDSAASDDNHDITMDSTAFSMHFHSLVKSDSGGKTLEEKTPSHISSPSDSGSFIVLTKAKKLIPHVSLPFEKVSCGRDSSDMSLVGENPHNYDYGKLSPTLEALLAEGSKDLQDSSVSDSNNGKTLKRKLSTFDENLSGHIDEKVCKDKETRNIAKLDTYTEGVSAACMELDEVNGISLITLVNQSTSGPSSRSNEDLEADVSVDQQMQTPNLLSKVNNDHSKALIGTNMLNIEFSVGAQRMNGKVPQLNVFSLHESRKTSIEGCLEETSTSNRSGNYAVYQNSDQHHRSPAVESISSLSSKQQQNFLDAAKSSRQLSYMTPSPKQPGSFFGKENIKSGENILPFYKTSSKFKIFDTSPLANSLKDVIEKSKLRLLKLHSSTTSPLNAVGEENNKDIEGKNVDALVSNLEKHLSSVDQKNMDHERTNYKYNAGIWSPKNDGSLSEMEGTISLGEGAESLIPMSSHTLSKTSDTQLMSEVASPSKFTSLQNKVSQHILMPENLQKQVVVFYGSDSPSVEIKLEHGNDVKTSRQPDVFVYPGKMLDQRLASSTENHSTVPRGLQKIELVSIGLGQVKTSIGNVTNNSHSAAVTDESESWFAEGTKLSTSSVIEINHFGDFNQVEKVHDEQSYPADVQNECETLPDVRTPSREMSALKFFSGSPDCNIPCATDPIYSKEELPGKRNEASLPAPDSLYIHWRNVNEPSLLKIGVLQDILVHLEKIKIYEILCSQIQPQKVSDHSSEVRHKRVAETKMLLYKLVYERARQQLKSVKHDKLLRRAQELSFAIHRSEMLKSNRRFLFSPSDRDNIVDNLRNSCTSNLGSKHEVCREKVATMKHECEALDRKIKNLTKSFHNYLKMKGEKSCSETIVLLNDHLKKKTSCRLVHEELQLWEVDDFGSRNEKQNLVLNYQGSIYQRFTINDGPIPSIFVLNTLNGITITKNFPNMDAWSAFACVLNAKNTKRHIGSKSFAQETQITCSLLHNLLDVVAEVQLAQLEIRNLVHTCFRSSSVEQLDLQLCFIDFNNGRKVMVTLDMTCLKCGIYPSDIFPCQLQASVSGTYISLPESLSAKIKAAVDGLRVGYSRIIRICRCISQVVQSSA
ncbi:uncharacterized protein LOC110653957 isoform X3 [Hevea brasiliensis]|uniref:uncharacterized protein LOC110653957 isoform X3 n=1 Tax=Hevea brasiliensis TaxID=3981 RepID=UPI0025E0C78F|nr:uncharacterized protein LOC110653957 isoform X3 [Hevea brasiliensis]